MVRVVLPVLRVSLLALALATLACGDLKDFRGTYEGPIVKGSFVRSCFADTTRATLYFDPEQAVAHDAGDAAMPITLSTRDTGETGDSVEKVFQNTVLEPVRSLESDHLSLLDFPGPERLRSYVLLARPTAGPLAGRDAFVVVSLLASDDVELRVLARTADATAACAAAAADGAEPGGSPDATAPHEYFGLFRLSKK